VSTASPARALAWKEGRGVALLLLGVVAGLVALALVFGVATAHESTGEAVLLLFAPLAAAAFGAAAVASERAERTLSWLIARPVPFRSILAWKAALHGAGAAAAFAVAAIIAVSLPQSGIRTWSESLDAPARHAWLLAVVLSALFFVAAFAASLFLPDTLTAALAGVVVGWAWYLLVLTPALLLGDSMAVAVLGLPWLLPALVGVPALLAVLATRLLRTAPQEPPSRATKLAIAAGCIVAAIGFAVSLREPLAAAAVLHGKGHVEAEPILEHPSGRAVAFVVTPPHGQARAVIAWLDASSDEDRLDVLPAGTRPVAWVARNGGLLVDWPDGARRRLPLSSYRHSDAAQPDDIAAAPGPEHAWIDGGRLVLGPTMNGAHAEIRAVVYPAATPTGGETR
jgi:ABC-type transport system involved in multi-copper enzyme maturation permease subunit